MAVKILPVAILIALSVGGVLALNEYTEASGRIDQSGIDGAVPWPDHLADLLAGPSADAYGWQKCVVRSGDVEGDVSSSWSAGVHDPGQDVSLRASSLGPAAQLRWAAQGGLVSKAGDIYNGDGWSADELTTPDSLSLKPLRSLALLSDRFDLDTIVPDPVNPDGALAAVQVLPNVDGTAWRVEGVPDGWPNARYQEDDSVRSALDRLSVHQTSVWMFEVWAKRDQISGLRFQTQGQRSEVIELRFLPIGDVFQNGEIVAPECPTDLTESVEDWRGFTGWEQTRGVPLNVSLDAAGRPYELKIWGEVKTWREHLGTLAVPGGRLLVMDGNSVQVNPGFFADESVGISVLADSVDQHGVHLINIDAIRKRTRADDGREWETPHAIRLGPANAEVTAWDELEFAYGTDGGVGGLIAAAIVDAMPNEPSGDTWIEDVDFEAEYQFFDRDDIDGNDTFLFSNGWGDGGFPMARGRDASGEVVSVIIWGTGVPWRLAVPDGSPPPDVTKREQELVQCLAGDRPVDLSGICPPDESD